MTLIDRNDEGGLRLNGTLPILTLAAMLVAGVAFSVSTAALASRNASDIVALRASAERDIARLELGIAAINADMRDQRTAIQAGQVQVGRMSERLEAMGATLGDILDALREVRTEIAGRAKQ